MEWRARNWDKTKYILVINDNVTHNYKKYTKGLSIF